MQCDKIEKFVKGTDSKSANLPQIFQSLHSHTATTNFLLAVAIPQNPHRVGGKPSAEIQENTESKKGLESSLTESRADLESKERLDSHFDTLDSNTESSSIESKDSQKQNLKSSLSDSK